MSNSLKIIIFSYFYLLIYTLPISQKGLNWFTVNDTNEMAQELISINNAQINYAELS